MPCWNPPRLNSGKLIGLVTLQCYQLFHSLIFQSLELYISKHIVVCPQTGPVRSCERRHLIYVDGRYTLKNCMDYCLPNYVGLAVGRDVTNSVTGACYCDYLYLYENVFLKYINDSNPREMYRYKLFFPLSV